ncbi:RNA methyltransferase [Leptolyngbya boryana CZ1]|uniref:tRNA (cytidine/uridine-2'-O-)-methyltransferase TrmJ n=1 Tax=Leptolyngbya boryana CZ1 TaxID=3060204 RepID=A0AA96WPW7_LEPBY|nr:RNA methyltransferase [Leptolyngbya boryana]WNZ43752.1 RNA methyltransferase [Leptolyngbya boryana CZ1]
MPEVSQVRIVLVEPAGALNVGSIARVMKNMGLHQLVLVNPKCDLQSDDARKMAMRAIDVLEAAKIVESIPEALVGCHRAVATAVRSRLDTTLEHPRQALPWLLEPGLNTAILFGSEDRGLSNDELKYAQRFVYIPTSEQYQSLNLAQAVAICCYELFQMPVTSETFTDLCSLDALDRYYQHLESVLLKIGYLQPHTAASRMEKFRHLFNRAELSEAEVSLLRGILRQVEWAIQTKTSED